MGTVPMANPLAQNAGKPVLGNTGSANPNSALNVPMLGNAKPPNPTTAPLSASAVTAQKQSGSGGFGTPATSTPVPIASPQTPLNPNAGSSTTPGTPASGSPVSNPITANYTPQQQQQLQKQLIDIYGKGEGGLLFGLINGMGAQNNAYMTAYEKAMAPVNAENLATLNTTLGNSGIGANSSIFGIANADFEANVTAQEGLQEQQLVQQDQQDLINITESMQNAAIKEVSTSWLSDLGDVLTGIGGAIPGIGGLIKGIGGAISHPSNGGNSTSSSPSSVPTSQTGTDTDPNASGGSAGDISGTDTSIAEDQSDAFLF